MTSNTQIMISQFGAAELLAFQSNEIPKPQAGEVLVKVAFASINPIDVKTRAGLGWAAAHNKNNLPWVLGYDISGTVIKQGESSNKFHLNDQVAGFIGFPLRGGGYSQYLAIPENELALIPDDVSLEAAAAIPLAGQTAAQALEKAKIKADDKVLILAASGGVGHIATQIAVAAKTQVFGTCSEKNKSYVERLGATAIDYNQVDWTQIKDKFDVMIDLVGGQVSIDAMPALKAGSRLITVPTITSAKVCEKAETLGINAMGILVEPKLTQLEELLYFISSGMLKIDIEQVYSYQDVVQAHKKMESGHARGKILLRMQDEQN